ncbi:MAG: NADH-quinone oxidoreductase subunit NuoK [Deltaproteobacteria bacterium]|nr:NADH-quinone oxidoreductase subunit NuoK [Deltaproteobacteria bacterium]
MIVSEQLLHWSHFVVVCLFAVGLFGFLVRKNAVIALMSIELMLNSVNLIFVEISMRSGSSEGILMVVFVITVAAAEVAVGLGILLNLHRVKRTVELDAFKSLRG